MNRRLIVALTVLSLALPAAAVARTDPPSDPAAGTQGANASTKAQAPQFHGRTAAALRSGQAQPATPGVVTSSASGFDWGDAAIGAGVMLGLVAFAGGGLLVYRRSSPSIGPAATSS
jgi:hypothetical protein